jgi:hypothetical protein
VKDMVPDTPLGLTYPHNTAQREGIDSKGQQKHMRQGVGQAIRGKWK